MGRPLTAYTETSEAPAPCRGLRLYFRAFLNRPTASRKAGSADLDRSSPSSHNSFRSAICQGPS